MTRPPDDSSSLSSALAWSARIMAVALEMVVPGIGGHWLDQRLGTNVFVIVGFSLGLVAGVAHLLAMVGAFGKNKDRRDDPPPDIGQR